MRYDCKKLSVILPAYNEGASIYHNALETSKTVSVFVPDYEIIVVNDGSSDQTAGEARRAASEDSKIRVLDNLKNSGKGYALKAGTMIADGDYIAFCDADLDIHPRQLEAFLEIMAETQCGGVIGSKMHKDSQVDYPLHRRVISWGYYIVLLILFRLNVKDTQTGLKLFKADAIKTVMQKMLVKRFAYDIEMLVILHSQGEKIISAPVTVLFRRGFYGNRIKLKDIFFVTVDTMAIFYRTYILRYYDKKGSEIRGD